MKHTFGTFESRSEAGAAQGVIVLILRKIKPFFPGATYFPRVAGSAQKEATSVLVTQFVMIFIFGFAKKD